jgi:hypothetical protein
MTPEIMARFFKGIDPALKRADNIRLRQKTGNNGEQIESDLLPYNPVICGYCLTTTGMNSRSGIIRIEACASCSGKVPGLLTSIK